MNRNKLAVLASLGLLSAAAVYASTRIDADNDAVQVLDTKLGLGEAVSIAEHHAGGRASRAELEDTRKGLAYDIEVVTPGKAVFDVAIDARSGAILRSIADGNDHDDVRDRRD